MKLSTLFAALLGLFLTQQAVADTTVFGEWQGYGFRADLQSSPKLVRLSWDDGTAGVIAGLNPIPNPAPRCICDVYQRGKRVVIVELDIATGRPSSATYDNSGAFLGEALEIAPDAMCTRDFNAYGNPSECSCPSGYAYDSRNFLCRP
jgi:hypothetical protein